MSQRAAEPRRGLNLDYLGKKLAKDDPRFQVLEAVTEAYPPAFIITSCRDFLKEEAQPMYEFLTGKGIDAQYHCYGTPDAAHVGHVFRGLFPEIRITNRIQPAGTENKKSRPPGRGAPHSTAKSH